MVKSASLPLIRNGLKWRNGRPRWEPSPASRKAGIKGRDLKGLDGRWLIDRGMAISLADARWQWAKLYREAKSAGPIGASAREALRLVLEQLQPPRDDDSRLRRAIVSDLLEAAALLLGQDIEIRSSAAGPTVDDLVAGYLADPPKDIAAKTLVAYRHQSRKILEKWTGYAIKSVTTGGLYSWYHDELSVTHSLSTANQVMGALGAFYLWGIRKDWLKAEESPVRRLGIVRATGRTVTWSFDQEQAMVAFCDANGFEDVADAIVAGCWTGARQIDMCNAALGDLSQDTWLYTPQKTRRKNIQALPGILPAVRARIDRRKANLHLDGVRYFQPDQAPFLWNPVTGLRHNSDSIGDRFAEARTAAAASNITGLSGISGLQLRDTRDTCVTRLFYACDMSLDEICPWTGHSRKSAEQILFDHYIVLKRAGAEKTAAKLLAYASAHGYQLT